MVDFLDRCRFLASAGDTGDFSVASAVPGMLTPIQAGVIDGRNYRYEARKGDTGTQWEFGTTGVDTGLNLYSRTVIKSSNSNNRVPFSVAPRVRVGGPLARDMHWDHLLTITASNDTVISGSLPRSGYVAYKIVGKNLLMDTVTLAPAAMFLKLNSVSAGTVISGSLDTAAIGHFMAEMSNFTDGMVIEGGRYAVSDGSGLNIAVGTGTVGLGYFAASPPDPITISFNVVDDGDNDISIVSGTIEIYGLRSP